MMQLLHLLKEENLILQLKFHAFSQYHFLNLLLPNAWEFIGPHWCNGSSVCGYYVLLEMLICQIFGPVEVDLPHQSPFFGQPFP